MDKKELAEAEKFFDELCKTFGTGKYRPGWVVNDAPKQEDPAVKTQFAILDGIQQNLVIGTTIQ